MEILNNDVRVKCGVHAKYILFECNICGRTFGKNVGFENELDKVELLCQRCSAEKVANEIQ